MVRIKKLILKKHLILCLETSYWNFDVKIIKLSKRRILVLARTESYEFSGIIDKNHHLVINKELPVNGPKKVRVIILVEDDNLVENTDFLMAAQAGGAFDFWNDPEEDIYTIKDGKAIG